MTFCRCQILVLGALMVVFAASAPAMAGKDCKCRANGRTYLEGETACVRGHVARCDMFLNNTSWTFLPEDCPQSRLPADRRLAQLLPNNGADDRSAVCMP